MDEASVEDDNSDENLNEDYAISVSMSSRKIQEDNSGGASFFLVTCMRTRVPISLTDNRLSIMKPKMLVYQCHQWLQTCRDYLYRSVPRMKPVNLMQAQLDKLWIMVFSIGFNALFRYNFWGDKKQWP